MAYATEIRAAQTNLFTDRLNAFVEAFRKARRQNRVYKQTLAELNALSHRELADLGIGSYEIPVIAREAAAMVD